MSTFPHPTYSRTVLQPAYSDAQAYLFEPMLAAHEAHAVMLAECDIISSENAAAILSAVAQVREQGIDAYGYQPGVEDLFFRIESEIIQIIGADFGGNLQLARSRNDLGQALARMALRSQILAAFSDLLTLRLSVHALAQRHLQTLMPGYTHTQPAQPVTFAHYLAGVLSALAKDQARLAGAYSNVNESPLGAAAFTGTGFAINRQRLADLLGFDAVIHSTHHSIGAGDHLTDSAFAAQSLAIGLSRVTKDLIFLATQEASAIHIDDSFIQISSIMPQKRNPVVLEHLRARLSRVIGAAQTVAIQCHNIPYGDTQDIEDEILPPIMQSIDTMRDCITLYTAVFDTLSLNESHLHKRAADGFTTATELADVLVRQANVPFRLSHKIVAMLVQDAIKAGLTSNEVTLVMLNKAATSVLGQPLDKFSEADLAHALDPQHFVESRTGPGGVSAEATGALLDELQERIAQDQQQFEGFKRELSEAEEQREFAVQSMIDANVSNA